MIDDEAFCLDLMKALLTNIGIETEILVDFCINGEEAISLLKSALENGISYKVIFTDFNMPVMDGLVATRKMREILSEHNLQTPIVGVTGYASSKYHAIGLQAGMTEVVAKPLYFQTLIEVFYKYYN